MRPLRLALLLLPLVPVPALAAESAVAGPSLGPVPVEFILFGLVLLGVAVFHHQTLRVALTGATTIALYKIFFSRSTPARVWEALSPIWATSG